MIFSKIRKSILFYTIAVLGTFVISHFLLKLLNIRYRQWVYYFVICLTIVGIIAGTIQLVKRRKKPVKIIASISGICITIFVLYYWQLFLLGLVFSYYPEHVINKDSKKYVAYVKSFLRVNVDYYDYINFFLVGNKVKIHEYYGKGGYDPFTNEHSDKEPLQYYYYDDNGKVTKTNVKKENITINNNQSNMIMNPQPIENTNSYNSNDILYEKQFDKNTIIRIVHRDYILAKRELISVEKTEDGGKTWNMQTEEKDGVIQIHSGAKFTFITDKVGFINDPGLVGTSGDNRGLLVTTDGGKKYINTIFELGNLEKNIYIDDVPYLEDNKLKVKAHIIKNSVKEYYYFFSIDNGITWKQD